MYISAKNRFLAFTLRFSVLFNYFYSCSHGKSHLPFENIVTKICRETRRAEGQTTSNYISDTFLCVLSPFGKGGTMLYWPCRTC